MDDGLFKYLAEEDASRGEISWKCDSCKFTSKKFLADILELHKTLDATVNIQKKQGDDIDKVIKRVSDLEEITKKQPDRDGELQERVAASLLEEQKERESRRNNVVIHSIDEAVEAIYSVEERKEVDVNNVQELFHKIGSEVDVKKEIKFLARLGDKDAEKPRPLLVGFASTTAKDNVMANAKKLKEMDAPLNNVNIIHDITPKQRKEEQKLFTEAKKKNEAMGGTNSENFQWMVIGKRGERSLVRRKKRNKPDASTAQSSENEHNTISQTKERRGLPRAAKKIEKL